MEQEKYDQSQWRPNVIDVPDGVFKRPIPQTKLEKWRKHLWPRSHYCELCWQLAGPGSDVLDCKTCNIVVHLKCAQKLYPQNVTKNQKWKCKFCLSHVQQDLEDYYLQKATYEKKVQEIRTTIKLQKVIRMWLAKIRYNNKMNDVVRVQALVRSFVTRCRFRDLQKKIVKPFKIKICDLMDLTVLEKEEVPSKNYTVVVSILNYKENELKVSYMPSDKQIYRYETNQFVFTGMPGQICRVNQTFLIPGCINQVWLCLTILRKESVRNEFWGQAFVNLKEYLSKSKKTKIKLKLNEFMFEPKDKKSSLSLRTKCLENVAISGIIDAEIHPISNLISKAAWIEELSVHFNGDAQDAMNRGGPGKWWWCVMVKETLYLYKQFGDSNHYKTIIAAKVLYTEPIIKVLGTKEIFNFTVKDLSQRKDFFGKLRAAVNSNISQH